MLKIVTDSAANLTAEQAKEAGIEVLPYPVIFGNETLLDGVTLTVDGFYERLVTDPAHPHTSQINVSEFEEAFSRPENACPLFVILLSSALSGTADCARLAARNLGREDIYVYDSLGASIMEKMLVREAIKRRDLPAEELAAVLDDIRSRMELYAIVDTLDYLYKGGRLKKSAATLGKIFRIKPVVTVSHEGKVELCGKAVGTALAIKNVAKRISDVDENFPVEYLYSADDTLCRRLFNETAERIGGAKTEFAANLCPVIGVHIGPGAAGICFVRKKQS